uniref:Cytochrome c-type protein n=1 Tax=Magnetococcus massalia (strain MO-1) TaxID=451514 RepID=A0A1S7LDZ6_MAGMO|nr:Cytochrome c-type protein napC [Candidatus Magnetococcus massalia]
MGWLKSLWQLLRNPSSKIPLGVLVVGGGVAGIIFIGTLHFGLAYTNTMEFCVSCHSMKFPYEEYKESPHYQNQSGVRATCADCHVPHDKYFTGWLDKMWAKIYAAKDVYHEILGTASTKEKFEAHRWTMANRVWDKMRARGSKECLHCHNFEFMDFGTQDRMASKRHKKAIEKGEHCIDCHKGIAHEEPDEPEEDEE